MISYIQFQMQIDFVGKSFMIIIFKACDLTYENSLRRLIGFNMRNTNYIP